MVHDEVADTGGVMFFFRDSSRAFQNGLRDGFTAPFRFAAGSRRQYTVPLQGAERDAWREVGKLLNDSYLQVGREIGRTAPKTTRKKRGN